MYHTVIGIPPVRQNVLFKSDNQNERSNYGTPIFNFFFFFSFFFFFLQSSQCQAKLSLFSLFTATSSSSIIRRGGQEVDTVRFVNMAQSAMMEAQPTADE